MVKMNFEPFSVDNLFRGPGDWNSGTPRSHDDNVAIGPAFKKTDVAIMGEDFWPKLQVRRCFEDRHLRRAHEKGIGFVHSVCRLR